MKRVVGYKGNGQRVYQPEGVCSMSILICKGCGKVISNMCGAQDVYCPECAVHAGVVSQVQVDRDQSRMRA